MQNTRYVFHCIYLNNRDNVDKLIIIKGNSEKVAFD